MGLYFIADPDGQWIEILPTRQPYVFESRATSTMTRRGLFNHRADECGRDGLGQPRRVVAPKERNAATPCPRRVYAKNYHVAPMARANLHGGLLVSRKMNSLTPHGKQSFSRNCLGTIGRRTMVKNGGRLGTLVGYLEGHGVSVSRSNATSLHREAFLRAMLHHAHDVGFVQYTRPAPVGVECIHERCDLHASVWRERKPDALRPVTQCLGHRLAQTGVVDFAHNDSRPPIPLLCLGTKNRAYCYIPACS